MPVGKNAEREAHKRAGENRRPYEQAEFGLAKTQIFFYLHADDRKDRPDCEADCEGDCGHAKRATGARRNATRRCAHDRAPLAKAARLAANNSIGALRRILTGSLSQTA
ncbi:MAG: hypothetical protein Kow00133_19690 [Amphiplicatus sp.]